MCGEATTSGDLFEKASFRETTCDCFEEVNLIHDTCSLLAGFGKDGEKPLVQIKTVNIRTRLITANRSRNCVSRKKRNSVLLPSRQRFF